MYFVAGGSGNRRDDLVESDSDRLGSCGVERDLPRRRVEVSGRLAPLLALAAVHRELHGVAVGAAEGLVPVEERLDLVGARRNLREAHGGETQDVALEDRLRSGLPAVDVDSEDLLAAERVVGDLRAGLFALVGREEKQQASVERRGAPVCGVRDGEAHLRALSARRQRHDRGQGHRRQEDEPGAAHRHHSSLPLLGAEA